MLDRLFESSSSNNPFSAYSSLHLTAIFVLLLGIFLLFFFRKQLHDTIVRIVFVSFILEKINMLIDLCLIS